MVMSEADGKRQRPELIRLVLPVEFLGPDQVGIGNPRRAAQGEGDAGLQVANQQTLVDIGTAAKTVAVEKYVAGDKAPLEAGKDVPANAVAGAEEIYPGRLGRILGGP